MSDPVQKLQEIQQTAELSDVELAIINATLNLAAQVEALQAQQAQSVVGQ